MVTFSASCQSAMYRGGQCWWRGRRTTRWGLNRFVSGGRLGAVDAAVTHVWSLCPTMSGYLPRWWLPRYLDGDYRVSINLPKESARTVRRDLVMPPLSAARSPPRYWLCSSVVSTQLPPTGDACRSSRWGSRPSAVELTAAFISQQNQLSDQQRSRTTNTAHATKRRDEPSKRMFRPMVGG